jgi:hypothetical protein
MKPRPKPLAALPLALLALAACAQAPARSSPEPGRATPLAPPAPMSICIGCGRISAMQPDDLPRWRFTVQMDDGTEMLVYQQKSPQLALGARVRVVGGILELR